MNKRQTEKQQAFAKIMQELQDETLAFLARMDAVTWPLPGRVTVVLHKHQIEPLTTAELRAATARPWQGKAKAQPLPLLERSGLLTTDWQQTPLGKATRRKKKGAV